MIYGLGVDITSIQRVHDIRERNVNFIKRVLSPAEMKVYVHLSEKRKDEFLTGRFSAKESYSKALGTGIGRQISFEDLTILNDKHGKPIITHPYPIKFAAHVSISHTDEYVMTEVILEEK